WCQADRITQEAIVDHRTIVSFFTCQLVWVNRYAGSAKPGAKSATQGGKPAAKGNGAKRPAR
ncbi:hypothetical protein, partial [Aeromonas hydrophila]|uniref:hypothetical protein n=1 Tax=Aeromonas hydrophila TaxID=644 RepID=UPI003EC52BAC